MKHTGQRFERRVAQNVSEILIFWDTLPSKSCPVWNSGVNLEPLWGHFAALWGHFGVLWFHFELTLAQVGRSWRQVGAKLAQLGPQVDPKLAQVGSKFAKVEPRMASNVYLGTLWLHLGVTLGYFRDTWGSFWGDFGRLPQHFGWLWREFETILSTWGSHGKHFGPFSENTHFPNWF